MPNRQVLPRNGGGKPFISGQVCESLHLPLVQGALLLLEETGKNLTFGIREGDCLTLYSTTLAHSVLAAFANEQFSQELQGEGDSKGECLAGRRPSETKVMRLPAIDYLTTIPTSPSRNIEKATNERRGKSLNSETWLAAVLTVPSSTSITNETKHYERVAASQMERNCDSSHCTHRDAVVKNKP